MLYEVITMKIRIPDEIFNIRKYSAVVVSNRNVATFIKELVLKLDQGQHLEFRAGAYIQIDIPEYHASFRDFNIEAKFKPDWDRFNLWGLQARAEGFEYRRITSYNVCYTKLLRTNTLPDADKVDMGQKAAGTRVRKALQAVRTECANLRKESLGTEKVG